MTNIRYSRVQNNIRCEMTPTSSGGDKLVSVVGVNPPSDIASGRIAEMRKRNMSCFAWRASRSKNAEAFLNFVKEIVNLSIIMIKKITIYQSKRTRWERKIQKKYSIQRFLRKIKFIQKKLDSYMLLWYYNIRCTRETHFP